MSLASTSVVSFFSHTEFLTRFELLQNMQQPRAGAQCQYYQFSLTQGNEFLILHYQISRHC